MGVDLTEFDISISDLTYEVGEHTLKAVIKDGLDTYGEAEFSIFVCEDSDADGYCTDTGDCDDNDYFRNPGKTEICDGIDNDCDGTVDEDIAGMGEQLNKPCNDWPGSMCAGTFVCNPNGTNLICMPENGIFPGEREEVCDNMIDDDCDGTTDESGGSIDNVPQPECATDSVWCIEDQERACGQCGTGISQCVNGRFGTCTGDSSPKAETCNRIDDDCDDIVDNVYGENSVDGTSCQCYNGGLPKTETCNNIDDDCNGQIDEGAVNCCIDETTMKCGTDLGACEFGIKNCKNGQWGTCIGGIEREPEDECCDYIDNDCDGTVDNGCPNDDCDTVDPTTQESMIYWVMIGAGVIMLLGVLFYVGYIQKKKNSI